MASKSRLIALLCEQLESEIEIVERFSQGIDEWDKVAKEKLRTWESRMKRKKDVSEYDFDVLADETYMLDKTRRVAYATSGIVLFAVVESFLLSLCVNMGIKITNKKGEEISKPNWGHFRERIEKSSRIQFDNIQCFTSVERVRLLSNCLKHSNGGVSKELAKEFHEEFGSGEGEDIDYESENWEQMISGCKSFLTELAGKMLL